MIYKVETTITQSYTHYIELDDSEDPTEVSEIAENIILEDEDIDNGFSFDSTIDADATPGPNDAVYNEDGELK